MAIRAIPRTATPLEENKNKLIFPQHKTSQASITADKGTAADTGTTKTIKTVDVLL